MGSKPQLSQTKKDDTLYCSFCGKGKDEVFHLVAGPAVFICDECIAMCNELLAHEKAKVLTSPLPQSHLERIAIALERTIGSLDKIIELMCQKG